MMDRHNSDEGREEVQKERGKMEKGKKMGHDEKDEAGRQDRNDR